jgi:cytochrome c5
VSKQDSQFIGRFSIIVLSLTVLAVILLLLSRGMAAATPITDAQDGSLAAAEAAMAQAIAAAASQPAGAVPASQAATAAPPPRLSANASEGEIVYQQSCLLCHGAGVAGAPKLGDSVAWKPRLAQGRAVMYDHAIRGYTGRAGVMPPKGGRMDLSDSAVQAASEYMILKSQN